MLSRFQVAGKVTYIFFSKSKQVTVISIKMAYLDPKRGMRHVFLIGKIVAFREMSDYVREFIHPDDYIWVDGVIAVRSEKTKAGKWKKKQELYLMAKNIIKMDIKEGPVENVEIPKSDEDDSFNELLDYDSFEGEEE